MQDIIYLQGKGMNARSMAGKLGISSRLISAILKDSGAWIADEDVQEQALEMTAINKSFREARRRQEEAELRAQERRITFTTADYKKMSAGKLEKPKQRKAGRKLPETYQLAKRMLESDGSLSVSNVARETGVSANTLYKHIAKGQIVRPGKVRHG